VSVERAQRATLSVFLTASHHVRRERRRAQYRGSVNRSIEVGPETDRDRETARIVGGKATGLVLDSTLLPPYAVYRAVSQVLGVVNGHV
jgi:hypothetical protein